jgi:hypothetical protein
MICCPRCKGALRLLPGEKYWVHDEGPINCQITSIPNDPAVVEKLRASPKECPLERPVVAITAALPF